MTLTMMKHKTISPVPLKGSRERFCLIHTSAESLSPILSCYWLEVFPLCLQEWTDFEIYLIMKLVIFGILLNKLKWCNGTMESNKLFPPCLCAWLPRWQVPSNVMLKASQFTVSVKRLEILSPVILVSFSLTNYLFTYLCFDLFFLGLLHWFREFVYPPWPKRTWLLIDIWVAIYLFNTPASPLFLFNTKE